MITRRCCQNPPRYDIVYDCDPDEDQNLILCSYHYNLESKNPAFSRKIISMKVLPTIEEILGLDED